MILTILLPTYNRQKELQKNIEMLCGYIRKAKASNKVCIMVSNNCSTDQTEAVVHKMIADNSDIHVSYRKNETNLGIGGNQIQTVCVCETEFGMYLGDDDYIQYDYLVRVLEVLESGKAKCVIPSYYNIDTEGNRTGKDRDLDVKSQFYEPGFQNCLNNSWRAHQMSGLVFLIEPARKAFESNRIENIYPCILAVACSCMIGRTYHLTDFPVAVTRPNQAKKDWGYGKCGLIPDIYENYKFLSNISLKQRSQLEKRLIFAQYWRVAMYLKLGISDFFGCIAGVQQSPNTTKKTASAFPFIVVASFIKNGFELLFKGKLLNALRTKVDIKQ